MKNSKLFGFPMIWSYAELMEQGMSLESCKKRNFRNMMAEKSGKFQKAVTQQ